jgi:putative FmdB family regulatory protein
MPTYEYECGSCRHRFERKQRFDDEPVAMCPKCGGKARRVIHSVPVIFKGSGFYTTDSRKGMPEPEKGGEELPGEGKKKGKK